MSPRAKQLTRHYLEMVAAMFVGMAVLGMPIHWAASAVGIDWSGLLDDSPAVMFLEMATTMTMGMVGWMLHRGHGWRANLEMSASMYVPTFAVIGVLWSGAVTDTGVLMVAEHVAMLAAMAGVMIARPHEYACHSHGADPAIATA
jgi:flagellar biosynthetic protein FliP